MKKYLLLIITLLFGFVTSATAGINSNGFKFGAGHTYVCDDGCTVWEGGYNYSLNVFSRATISNDIDFQPELSYAVNQCNANHGNWRNFNLHYLSIMPLVRVHTPTRPGGGGGGFTFGGGFSGGGGASGGW